MKYKIGQKGIFKHDPKLPGMQNRDGEKVIIVDIRLNSNYDLKVRFPDKTEIPITHNEFIPIQSKRIVL